MNIDSRSNSARKLKRPPVLAPEHHFFLAVEEDAGFPGLSLVIDPLPNGRVVLLEPSERFVIVPEPNFCVVPVTVLPLLSRSVVIEPLPNGRVVLLEPSERFVIVPEPNFCVVPVTVLPLLSRSVVIEPLPNGRVVLLEPSERFVIVPEPNFCVVPVRGLLIELLGASAAKELLHARAITRENADDTSILAIFLALIFQKVAGAYFPADDHSTNECDASEQVQSQRLSQCARLVYGANSERCLNSSIWCRSRIDAKEIHCPSVRVSEDLDLTRLLFQ